MNGKYIARLLLALVLIGAMSAHAAQPVVVKSVGELESAVRKARAGQVIAVADGVYRNVELEITASGREGQPIIIRALNPGQAIISGDSSVSIHGEHVILAGFYFKDGDRDPDEWGSHGPGLVTVYSSHVRITECAFHRFDTADGGWITVTPPASGKVPEFVRIDHCSFTDKPTFDQVINLNNCDRKLWESTYKKVDGAEGAPPMYHRVDHCYFSNPPKTGNAGGGIRIGTWRNDTGRSLVDHNLFERHDSEAEIITSKSRENIFYANTFKNCQGTLNFRHGDRQYAIHNYFLGTDELFGYGGMFIWGSDHAVVGNYFYLPRTLKDRGEACLYLNAGVAGSSHARADRNLIANNIVLGKKGSVADLTALLERRADAAKAVDERELLPTGNRFVGNVVATLDPSYKPWAFVENHEAMALQQWTDNIQRKHPLDGASVTGNDVREFELVVGEGGLPMPSAEFVAVCRRSVSFEVDSHLPVDPNALVDGKIKTLSKSPAIDLDGLEEVARPLEFKDVGPSWLKENPSSYTADGAVQGELLKMMCETHAHRDRPYKVNKK
ncbi:MAG: chloramphenicol resistance protein [Verrucomicrobia bacterium]|nr:chloramphenicol resistance protein [Verrucomicrobiota bacterium]